MPRVVPTEIVSVIDQNFGWAAKKDRRVESTSVLFSQTPALAGIVDLLDKLPDELLTLDDSEFATFVICRTALRHVVLISSAVDRDALAWPRPGDRNALSAIRELLLKCRDEPPLDAASNELMFIDDEDWRETLRFDLRAIEGALQNGEWKATIVLGGSLVEALLLWSVSGHDLDTRRAAVVRAVASGKFVK
jgi:hypothetical protein